MPREFKPIYRTKADDIYIRVDKLITQYKCIVPNCKEIDCYDIQLEQPEGFSFMGGTFCKNHLECIFNFSLGSVFYDYEEGVKFADAVNKLPPVTPQPKTGYISIDDAMSVFDDFMCGEVDEDGTDTFLKMLKDKAESES